MCPIPGNIVGLRVMDIARCRLRDIRRRLAIRWPAGEITYARPEGPDTGSPVMPERMGEERTGDRRRRSKPRRCSRASRCLVRAKHQRDRAERHDKRRIHSIRHGTHQFVGYYAAPQRTLGRAYRARKHIANY